MKRLLNSSLRYCGSRLFGHLYAITAILYCRNCFRGGSQFNWRCKGVRWSYFLEFLTILLAKFWILTLITHGAKFWFIKESKHCLHREKSNLKMMIYLVLSFPLARFEDTVLSRRS